MKSRFLALALMTGLAAHAAENKTTKIKGFQARAMMQALASNAVNPVHNFADEPNKETWTQTANTFYCQYPLPQTLPDKWTTNGTCSWGWPGTIGGGTMGTGALSLAQQIYGYGQTGYMAGFPTIVINGVQCELKVKRTEYNCTVYWTQN